MGRSGPLPPADTASVCVCVCDCACPMATRQYGLCLNIFMCMPHFINKFNENAKAKKAEDFPFSYVDTDFIVLLRGFDAQATVDRIPPPHQFINFLVDSIRSFTGSISLNTYF